MVGGLLAGGVVYFYPRPPRGGRPWYNRPNTKHKTFLSTPSARRATQGMTPAQVLDCLFLSTPSARRATHGVVFTRREQRISIHALREEGDYSFAICLSSFAYFYPRPPRGGRPPILGIVLLYIIFLSTPSARRATCREFCVLLLPLYFYPRPPRGGRLPARPAESHDQRISIHALREEGDQTRSHCRR